MPKIGEIRRGTEIGKKHICKYIWHACIDCGKERWVQLVKEQPTHKRCIPCAGILHGKIHNGANSPTWKGGKRINSQGYNMIKLLPDDPFYSMANNHGTMGASRLIVAKLLGRFLEKGEEVHHKNEIKNDDRPKNLVLLDKAMHNQLSRLSRWRFKSEKASKLRDRLIKEIIKEEAITC